jgi:hypothetical protein
MSMMTGSVSPTNHVSSTLADVAPHRYAKYRKHILYNTDETGKSKPQLVVLEGGKG